MQMSRQTEEQIHNIEKTIWGFRPIWLLTSALALMGTTASIVWQVKNYDTNNDKKIDGVSAKVDKLSAKIDRQHLLDSVTADARYNEIIEIISATRKPVRVNQPVVIAGYTATKGPNGEYVYARVN